MNLLSLLGLDRWLAGWSERVHQALSEGASGLEARVLLARLEWEDEKRRLQCLLVLTLAALAFTMGVLLVISAALVVHFWDTPYRSVAAWCVALAWIVLWIGSVVGVLRTLRAGSGAFVLTRSELANDWQALKERL